MIVQVAGHLWQSTLFAGAAFLLTLALRKNRAHIRYWVWFAASIKFLVPFFLLIALGSQVSWRTAPADVSTNWVAVVDQVSTPLMAPVAAAQSVVAQSESGANYLPAALLALWVCGFATVAVHWLRRWRRLHALRASATRVGTLSTGAATVPVMSSGMLHEPAVVGILRPVLLLPSGIAGQIERAQLEAILAHELAHVRRRDNLTAAIHMIVEALFWFHPLVWWLGARLVEERERACDEAVLQAGGDPSTYAEGILNVCKLYLESPLVCMSGVSGSDLRKRIEAIMNNRTALKLDFARRAVVAGAGAAAVAAPLIIGVLGAPFLTAQSTLVGTPGQSRPSFEVASVKWIDRDKMERNHEGHLLTPKRFVDRTELMQFISMAYIQGNVCTPKTALGLDCSLIVGSIPSWAKTERFEIIATLPDANPVAGYTARQLRVGDTRDVDLMLQVLLEDRFKLKVHRETRDLPVYVLTVAKGGPKLSEAVAGQSEFAKAADGTIHEAHGFRGGRRTTLSDGSTRLRLNFQSSSMQEVAEFFAEWLDRPVLDRTGLTPDYDFEIEYLEDLTAPNLSGHPVTPRGLPLSLLGRVTIPILSDALNEVGLQLESTKAPMEVLVIDHVERPTGN